MLETITLILRCLTLVCYIFCTVSYLAHRKKPGCMVYGTYPELLTAWGGGLVLFVAAIFLKGFWNILFTVGNFALIVGFLYFLKQDQLTESGIIRTNMLLKRRTVSLDDAAGYGPYKWWCKKYDCWMKETVVFCKDGKVERFSGMGHEQIAKTLSAQHIIKRNLVGPSKEKPKLAHPWER